MKPYPREVLGIRERVFNYRLSRARRIIENTFGIGTERFRILRRPTHARVELVVNVTKAVVVLHNYLMAGRSFREGSKYCPIQFVDSDIRQLAHRLGNGEKTCSRGSGNETIDQSWVQ